MICETEQIVDLCLNEAMADEDERRRQHRKPFLRPAEISLASDSAERQPAFCRDISRTGIGLLHEQALPADAEFVVYIPILGRELELHCRNEWCACLRNGRYYSGNAYRCATTPQSIFLLSAVVSEKLNRRVHRRYPLFRSVVLEDLHGKRTEAFCRDVSRQGIGFVHRESIVPGTVVVTMESSMGSEVMATAELERCVAIGQGWFASGGPFLSGRSTVS